MSLSRDELLKRLVENDSEFNGIMALGPTRFEQVVRDGIKFDWTTQLSQYAVLGALFFSVGNFFAYFETAHVAVIAFISSVGLATAYVSMSHGFEWFRRYRVTDMQLVLAEATMIRNHKRLLETLKEVKDGLEKDQTAEQS